MLLAKMFMYLANYWWIFFALGVFGLGVRLLMGSPQ